MLPLLFQAEDGIRDDVESRGLGDVYKSQLIEDSVASAKAAPLPSPKDLMSNVYVSY
ncbi:hypothetical protein MPC1_12550002 [Methylocella tundrae]|nr:hypothetical protein MPC1_12550002 [Methylocella tundrae]